MPDPGHLSRVVSYGGTPLLQQLFTLYSDSAHDRAKRIVALLDGGDPDEARRAAHTLISSAGNLGGTEVMAMAAAIETLIVEGAYQDAKDAVRELTEAIEGHLTWLRARPEVVQ